MILPNRALPTSDVVRNLGMRFRDYRMRLRLTRKEVSVQAGIGMTTLYKFESGNMTDIAFSTLFRLMRAIGLSDNWEQIIPDLPPSPYLYDENDKKAQRVRHSKKESRK